MPFLDAALVLAVLAQIVFTFAVMIRAGRARVMALKEGRVNGDVRLSHAGWPPDVLQRSNNMNNQFETPTLFYALAILGLVLKANGPVFVVLAWGYVVFRVAHMLIHTGSNRLTRRFAMFLAGVGCLMAMTAALIVHVLAAGFA